MVLRGYTVYIVMLILKRNGITKVHCIYCYVNNIVIIACFGKTLLGYPTIPAWVFKSLS